ncbi:MAG: lipopolysaccharide biosynthesis protein [Gammaproteobacteria bacterium]|nr:lipopolysaccharide biosynthesis protein [Gammaproteobacteria bacterium]
MDARPERDPPQRNVEPRTGLGRRVLGGLFWAFSGTLVQGALEVIVTMALARLLAPAMFGAVAAALVAIKIAGFIANLGLTGALIQRETLDDEQVRAAFAVSIHFGLVVCLLLQLGAAPIAAFFQNDVIEDIVRLLSVAIPIANASQVALALMRRRMRFRQIATCAVISFGIGYGVVGIGLALSGYGVWALAGAHLAQVCCNTVLLLTLQPHPKAVLFRWSPLVELLRFGGGMIVWRTAANSAIEADNLVVGRWLGAEALGLYSRAYWLAATPAVLFGRGIASVLFPVLSRLQGDSARLAVAYRRGIAATNLVAFPASVAIVILAPEIVAVVLGEQWGAAVVPLRILAVGLLFRLGVRVSDSLTAAAGAVYRTAAVQVVYVIAVFAGALVGRYWGLGGVATGVFCALFLNYVLMTRLTLEMTSLPVAKLLATFVPALLTAAAIAAELLAVRGWLASRSAPPLAILAGAAVATGVTSAVILRLFPRAFIGDDGLWAVHLVLRRLPDSISTAASRLIAPYARPT